VVRRIGMGRLLRFLGLVLVLTLLMYGAWILSACLLPEGLLQRFFVGRFSNVVGEFTFWKVFLANLVVGFLGVQFMNLFRVGKHAGGLYVLPVFWLIFSAFSTPDLGIGKPVLCAFCTLSGSKFAASYLTLRRNISELVAYTLGYEASRGWAVWRQEGLCSAPRPLADRRRPTAEDIAYWSAGLLLLVVAVTREVGG
jgi:hypothetical protein